MQRRESPRGTFRTYDEARDWVARYGMQYQYKGIYILLFRLDVRPPHAVVSE